MSQADHAPVVLLTWNPEMWSPETGPFQTFLDGNMSVAPVEESWSTGARARLPIGSIAFLVRQHNNRGIVASGVTVSEVFQAPHWAVPGKVSNFVDVQWEFATSTEHRLRIENLLSDFPKVPWNYLQGSGVMPAPEQIVREMTEGAISLIATWDEHLESLGIHKPGFSRDSNYRLGATQIFALVVDEASVAAALSEAFNLGAERFQEIYIGAEFSRYRVVAPRLEVDARAVMIAAHLLKNPESSVSVSQIRDDLRTVANPLRDLGFYVENSESDSSDEAPISGSSNRYVQLARSLQGSLDVTVVSGQRREQALLRGALGFFENEVMECGICSREFPRKFLVAGHIKKRSECSNSERLDVLNVAMPVCVFGCDALFERRLIRVVNGLIATAKTGVSSVDTYLENLEGNFAPGYTEERKAYFSWHAEQDVLF